MRFLPSLLLILTVAGCAGGPDWVNPSVPKERWSSDLTGCRRDADDVVGMRYQFEPDDRSSLPGKMLDREDAHKRFDGYVASCMKSLGYRRAN